MFLDFVPVINALIILASVIMLGRSIAQNSRKEREQNQVREDKFSEMVKDVTSMASRIIDTQKHLDHKMNDLSRFVDAHSTNMAFQQNHFNSLAKADMHSARREELLRTKELKVALERLMGVAMTSRQPPSPNDVIALENITKRIKELETILS